MSEVVTIFVPFGRTVGFNARPLVRKRCGDVPPSLVNVTAQFAHHYLRYGAPMCDQMLQNWPQRCQRCSPCREAAAALLSLTCRFECANVAETFPHHRRTSPHRLHTTACAWVAPMCAKVAQTMSGMATKCCSVMATMPEAAASTIVEMSRLVMSKRCGDVPPSQANVCAPFAHHGQRKDAPMCRQMPLMRPHDVRDDKNVFTVRPHYRVKRAALCAQTLGRRFPSQANVSATFAHRFIGEIFQKLHF